MWLIGDEVGVRVRVRVKVGRRISCVDVSIEDQKQTASCQQPRMLSKNHEERARNIMSLLQPLSSFNIGRLPWPFNQKARAQNASFFLGRNSVSPGTHGPFATAHHHQFVTSKPSTYFLTPTFLLSPFLHIETLPCRNRIDSPTMPPSHRAIERHSIVSSLAAVLHSMHSPHVYFLLCPTLISEIPGRQSCR